MSVFPVFAGQALLLQGAHIRLNEILKWGALAVIRTVVLPTNNGGYLNIPIAIGSASLTAITLAGSWHAGKPSFLKHRKSLLRKRH